MIQSLIKLLTLFIFFVAAWYGIIALAHVPDYFLPTPLQVAQVLLHDIGLLLIAAKATVIEALLGFFLSLLAGCFAAIILYRFQVIRFFFLPVLLMSQAVPTLALAPLLVLWLGYGITSKIILVALILFFPISSAFLDGLRRTEALWLNLASLMTASRSAILWHIQLPAALPYLASGVRISAAGAMIGAIVGEWVGASQGLGFLLLEANARFQTAQVFAVIAVIVCLSLIFYWLIQWLLNRLIKW
jgi:putative hydroxymethylpyrimidine transport system permease protein